MCSRGLPLENDIPRSKPPLLNFHSPLFLLRCSLVIPSDSWLVFENFHPESFCLALWDFGRGNFFLMESVLLYFCFNSPVSCSFTVYPVFILISFFHLLSFIFSHIFWLLLIPFRLCLLLPDFWKTSISLLLKFIMILQFSLFSPILKFFFTSIAQNLQNLLQSIHTQLLFHIFLSP